jgi:subtilisin family serine protease
MTRHKRFRILLTSLAGTALLWSCASDPETGTNLAPLIGQDGPDAIAGQYIVVLRDDVAADAVSKSVGRVAGLADSSQVSRTFKVIPAYAARLTADALDSVRNDPDVAYVEQNAVIRLNTVHDVSGGPDGLDRIDQRQLPIDGQYNDFDRTGAGVDAYIVDTGINATHNEFTGRVGNGFDSIDGDSDPADCNGHGSHVASTVGGNLYGVAKGVTLHAARVLDCGGSGTIESVVAGVDFVASDCTSNGRNCVANMSLGGGFSQALNDSVANAVAAGIPFAVAAGNESQDACNVSPASEPSAITVGAKDDPDTRASFSNFGSCVDIFAPGVSILGANIGGNDASWSISGTSMASPHVAGAAALVRGENPALTPAEVQQELVNSASLNCISGVNGSPNVLLYVDFNDGQFDCGGSEPPPPEASCEGRCGQFDPAQPCQCDDLCQQFGDCCADFGDVCALP